MKLHYYKPSANTSNFGDELNLPIWEYFFEDSFDFDESEVFLGIGTVIRVINKRYKKSKRIIVFGSGCHKESMRVPDNADVIFVRGPLSCQSLKLNNNKFITDPALLTPLVFKMSNVEKTHEFSYMPHFTNDNKNLKKIIESLGINYISPKDDLKEIIRQINQTKVMLCEAMHAAIVADAYRIKWIPVYSYSSFNFFKWKDWSLSLGMNIDFNKIERVYANDNKLKILIKRILIKNKMKKIKNKNPYLSSKQVNERKKKELIEEINQLKSNF